MTLINAINTMKEYGVKTLVGFAGEQRGDIDRYLSHAEKMHARAVKYAPEIEDWQTTLDREDEHELINVDGHWCVVRDYGRYKMAVYGDFDDESVMSDSVNNYYIRQRAEALADKKSKEDSSMPRTAWVSFITATLIAANKASSEAFEREYGRGISKNI